MQHNFIKSTQFNEQYTRAAQRFEESFKKEIGDEKDQMNFFFILQEALCSCFLCGRP